MNRGRNYLLVDNRCSYNGRNCTTTTTTMARDLKHFVEEQNRSALRYHFNIDAIANKVYSDDKSLCDKNEYHKNEGLL